MFSTTYRMLVAILTSGGGIIDGRNFECGQISWAPRRRWQNVLKSWFCVTAKLQRWNELSKQRQQLRTVSDHLLKDIGLSHAEESRIVGNRWFWNDPVNRREDLDLHYRYSDHYRKR
jgi:uncharacterized protein YjiS (DUF1127 family)